MKEIGIELDVFFEDVLGYELSGLKLNNEILLLLLLLFIEMVGLFR